MYLQLLDVNYIEDVYHRYLVNLCAYATNRHLHFGTTVTSRVEGAHSQLKRALQVSTGDLLQVIDKFSMLITKQCKEHYLAMDDEKLRAQNRHRIPLFAAILAKITNFALNKIYDQYLLMLQEKKDEMESICGHVFTTTMGMPCLHVLREREVAGNVLTAADFHQQWVCFSVDLNNYNY